LIADGVASREISIQASCQSACFADCEAYSGAYKKDGTLAESSAAAILITQAADDAGFLCSAKIRQVSLTK
jgi:hypothetical protein